MKLSNFISDNWHKNLQKKDLALKGWNYGETEFEGLCLILNQFIYIKRPRVPGGKCRIIISIKRCGNGAILWSQKLMTFMLADTPLYMVCGIYVGGI